MTSTPPNKPSHDPQENVMVEALLQSARAASPDPSEALLARVLQDAKRVQQQPAAARYWGGFQAVLATLRAVGGWPALGGYATAALAGLWVGMSGFDPVLQTQDTTLQNVEALLALEAPLSGDLEWGFEEG